MLPEQGKLTINQKSLNDDDIEVTWTFSNETGEITAENPYIYGQALTIAVKVVHKNVCTEENGDITLTPVDYTSCLIVDECDKIEICGQGNYKDCESVTPPTPDPTCLTITAQVEAETLHAFDAVPEVGYTITGWIGEDGTEANIKLVEALLTPKFYKATEDEEGNLVKGDEFTGETLDAGKYIIEVEVDQANWPEALNLYKVGGDDCEDPTGTNITVDPICLADAVIEIIDEPVDEEGEPMDCFPYTGSEIKPEITVTLGDKELVEGTDYEVKYTNNIHVSEAGATITVTGLGNYATDSPNCVATMNFCIAPSTATVYVADINFDVYKEVIDPEGNTVKQYQNGKFYAQYETENNITLGYKGITAEKLEALGLEIKGKRFGGETVGYYSVAIFNGDEQLTPGKLKYEGEEAVVTSTLTEGEKTFGDIKIKFLPGLYEIKKNSEPLSYEWNPTKVYGVLRLDLTRMKDPTYIEDLKAEYREFFKGATYHGLDNDAKALIDKNIINIDNITMADIHVSPVVDGVVGDEYTIEQFAALVKRTHGNIPVGKYFVNITGAESVNYQLGTVTMNVEVTPRPIGIEFSNQTSGKHGSFNADAVTYTIVTVDGKDVQGLATGDNDETDLNIKAKLDGENITLDEEAFFDDTKVSGVYKYIGMNYEPIVTDGKYIIDDEPLHFIIHRTARNINWIDKEQTEETDLAISTWNDTEDRIIAFDGETVETVYFRTFNAAKVADDNLEQLFPDPELEPITYKDKDGNVVDENGGFWLYSNKWYSMVLPFDIYVYEFGTHPVFGHAVINVLDEKNADPLKMQFKLQEVGIIRANTPFIFKVGDKGDPDTYLATTGEGEDEMATTPIANLDELTFTNKKIVKPAKFDEIYVEDDSKLRFYGSYSGKGCLKDYEYYFSIAPMLESFDGYYFGSDDNTSWLYPSTCYGVDGNHAAGARQLIVQEEDGSFTAIKSIENVTYTNNAEGWFTTNGMKLNAQPTQRGIYIHNGKKVVVK
ncbi:MAG: hypothetical protein J5552_13175 [Prevotella sp.]|nr:hypothetical protein [Prevotella sp.]